MDSPPREYTQQTAQQQPPQQRLPQQVVDGLNTKADMNGLANSLSSAPPSEGDQPLSRYHSFFYDLFTWKYPRGTSFAFFSVISIITAFRFINVLRWVFKLAYLLFASVTFLEVAGRPFGARGFISTIRPNRYYTIPRESLESIFIETHELANFFVLELQRVIFAENLFATIVAFVATFTGYFLIKYIPLWALMLLSTITAFTAPLIYLRNQEFIDEQIRQGNKLVNEQLHNGRQLTEKYAGEAAARARATAGDITQKVQGYTHNVRGTSPPASTEKRFPTAPVHEPTTNGANGTNGAYKAYSPESPPRQPAYSEVERPILA